MQRTAHSLMRMNQRGITGDMVELAFDYGEPDGDKIVLSIKACRRLIEELKQQQKKLERALKKGGITIVSEGDALITTYRANSFSVAKAKKSRG